MTADQVKAQITQAAINRGIDPAFALAVAKQESNYNQAAVSSVGAIGIFQLMPATAQGLGVDPHDATQNIQGGVDYLAQLLDEFGGNMALALAAYNAGPGNVRKYGGIPPFQETLNYVSKILGSLGGALVLTDNSGPDDSGGPAVPGIDTIGVGIAIACGLWVVSRLLA